MTEKKNPPEMKLPKNDQAGDAKAKREKPQLIEFVLFEIIPGKRIQNRGEPLFEVAPRIGEHIIANDAQDQAQMYEVVDLIHPLIKSLGTLNHTVDLYIQHVDSSPAYKRNLYQQSPEQQ